MRNFYFSWVWFLFAAFVVCIVFFFSGVAGAEELPVSDTVDLTQEPVVEEVETYESENGDVIVNISLTPPSLAPAVPNDGLEVLDAGDIAGDVVDGIIHIFFPETSFDSGSVVVYDADDISLSDGLSSILISLFGEYTPRTYTAHTYFSDGSVVTSTEYVPGLMGLDWPWLAGVSLFALVLWSFFRLLGGVLRG